MATLRIFFLCGASLAFSACTGFTDYIPWVYRLDVDQGNIITQEMIDQLEPGMNKRQVRFIMGTPLVVDAFHKSRWDYIHSEQPGGEERRQKRVSLYFSDETLSAVQGDFRPSETPRPREAGDETVDVPKIERQKTLWEKIKGLFGFDDGTSATV